MLETKFKTKEEIIEVATEHVHDADTAFARRRLRLYVFPYDISIAIGEHAYCTPRESGLPWEDYENVELAIYAPCGDSENMAMLGSSDIYHLFGEDVALHCEGWSLLREEDDEEFSQFNQNSVMPYISWDDVLQVVNAIKRHTPEAKDQI